MLVTMKITRMGLLLLLVPAFTFIDAQCYNGWIRHRSSCYGFGEDDVTWAGAAALCRIFDGYLAEINSADENSFIEGVARNRAYKALWLGGTDVFSEGYWVWSGSKAPVQGFTDWYPGEPNHAAGADSEDCMQLSGHENMQWNDVSCRLNAHFVCEISMSEE